MAEVKRKKGETFEALVRRFSKKIQQSGRLIQSRKIRYYEPKKNKTAVRSAASRREEISEKREYLKKIGKLVDERDKRR
ncbi:30S ribosomal protein S21 [Candidatus Falkowbacteria bacterium]|uniref:30S ribosomal protein S21 n=1 Tax=Candidatus Buchananbacteria bacterium CG10_big_fil_rev_8_21_14_0_10_33_19 TaxID=1974525 RepID=A0A2H0W2Y1_9BACT|nr:30S ribosomal protein S21 [Candidatus Falkowbacteria bacterium]PIS05698.1 MAG: 30S ribosomal protein S21 [Candidatus Buchananbacteria bacterium CG10_big_fil_rev_8_21_14_0_10_33_19]